MTSETRHEYLQNLLAVTAVHAASAEEQRAVEEHVATCEECRIEFDQHRRTTTLLGVAPALPPERVWEQLSARLEEPPPPVRLVRLKRSSRYTKPLVAIAAALLIVAGGVIGSAMRSDGPVTETELAHEAQKAAEARKTVLTSNQGQMMADAVLMPNGRGYIVDSRMAPLPADKTYQLWAVSSGEIVSAGVLGPDPKTAGFRIVGRVTGLAVTVEKAGGVVSSSNAAVASGSFA